MLTELNIYISNIYWRRGRKGRMWKSCIWNFVLETWSKMAQGSTTTAWSSLCTWGCYCYKDKNPLWKKKIGGLTHRYQVSLKKGVLPLNRNHINVLKKRKLFMRLKMWEASHTSEKKEGWRYPHMSPEVKWYNFYTWASPWPAELCSRTHQSVPFTQCISLCFIGSSTLCRYLVEKYCVSFPLRWEICCWACTHYYSARVQVRFLSLPGAWQQWPPNGMGTTLPQHGHLVRTALHPSASSSMNVNKFVGRFCP